MGKCFFIGLPQSSEWSAVMSFSRLLVSFFFVSFLFSTQLFALQNDSNETSTITHVPQEEQYELTEHEQLKVNLEKLAQRLFRSCIQRNFFSGKKKEQDAVYREMLLSLMSLDGKSIAEVADELIKIDEKDPIGYEIKAYSLLLEGKKDLAKIEVSKAFSLYYDRDAKIAFVYKKGEVDIQSLTLSLRDKFKKGILSEDERVGLETIEGYLRMMLSYNQIFLSQEAKPVDGKKFWNKILLETKKNEPEDDEQLEEILPEPEPEENPSELLFEESKLNSVFLFC